MTIDEIREAVKIGLSAGIESTDSVFEDAFIENTIHNKRAAIISTIMSQNRLARLSESWVQQIDCGCNLNPYQCKDKVIFPCPRVVHINSDIDGFIYVGKPDGLKPFTRLKTSFMNMSMLDSMSSRPRMLWYPEVNSLGDHGIVIRGNQFLENMLVKIIASNPLDLPGFRRDVDEYPVDPNLTDVLIEQVTDSLLKKMRGKAPDTVPDFTDTQAKKFNK
jgi:hypothetical protein